MRRGAGAVSATVAVLALGACAGRPPQPNRAPGMPPSRFEIVAVHDTTFDFAVGPQRWLRPGATGIAVDPKRRDGLVARYRVIAVKEGVVKAVITGQTTRVTAEHVALAVKPAVPLFRQRSFWVGAFTGGLLAGVATSTW